MVKCKQCGEDLFLPHWCKYCGDVFCVKHTLPENHNCPDVPRGRWIPKQWEKTNRAPMLALPIKHKPKRQRVQRVRRVWREVPSAAPSVQQTMRRICSKCGKVLGKGDKFCSRCGKKLE